MMRLGVNVDHIATLRQARYKGVKSIHAQPDPVRFALTALRAGADSIVMHLREDRRHIQDGDLFKLKNLVGSSKINLEMSINPGIIRVASLLKPAEATLVPEKRQELTTEGGLDVVKYFNKIKKAVKALKAKKIKVSLFVNPQERQIMASKLAGADCVEIHTGKYSEAAVGKKDKFLKEIIDSSKVAKDLGLGINAGHGLNYDNVQAIAKIKLIEELNIGHSIIARSVESGLARAVREMLKLIR